MAKKYESGRSMIEMVGVLAVMGLLTAGAFILIQSGMQSQKRSRVVDEINAIVSEMQNIDLTKIEAETAANGTALPAQMSLPTDASGYGQYAIWRTQKEAADEFHVGIYNIETKDCNALRMRQWPSAVAVENQCANKVLSIRYKQG